MMHSPECKCDRCRNLMAAICAMNPDGSYFFTDTELLALSREPDDDDGPARNWCPCPICSPKN